MKQDYENLEKRVLVRQDHENSEKKDSSEHPRSPGGPDKAEKSSTVSSKKLEMIESI